MKEYIKPTIDVLELRVTENLAANHQFPGTTGGTNLAPITKYDMSTGASSY